jgi:predicted HD phosphohydrolase
MEPAGSVADLFAALRRLDGFSDSVIGDTSVDLLSHSLQCAWILRQGGADDDVVVAGLFHDVGHGTSPGQQREHGLNGASFVRAVLGERVARLVELHVPAKRFLVTTDPVYAEVLSPGSTASLVIQGGAADEDALEAFRSAPERDVAVQLRRADDAAKVPDADVPPVDHWEALVQRVAQVRHGHT